MLSEKQCKLIETGLAEEVEPRKVAAFLCLNMGLTIAEAGALRRLDVNLSVGTLTINNVLARLESADSRTPVELLPSDMARVLPMPPHVLNYLDMHIGLYGSDDCFIISGDTAMPALYLMQNILSTVCMKYSVADNLSATELRNAFIRRCIESGIDLYSLCWFIGIKQPNVILKRFGEYLKPRPNSFSVLEKYGPDYTPPAPPLPAEPKRMNLLILCRCYVRTKKPCFRYNLISPILSIEPPISLQKFNCTSITQSGYTATRLTSSFDSSAVSVSRVA